MRKHHEVATAHYEGLAFALAVHPGLAAPDEMKGCTGDARRIERPRAAITALLEDPGAQPQAVQNVRQNIRIRRFGYIVRTVWDFSYGHSDARYAATMVRARARSTAT
jgi:hypothetical protein